MPSWRTAATASVPAVMSTGFKAAQSTRQLLSVDTGHIFLEPVYCYKYTQQYHSMYDRLNRSHCWVKYTGNIALVPMAVQYRLQYSIL